MKLTRIGIAILYVGGIAVLAGCSSTGRTAAAAATSTAPATTTAGASTPSALSPGSGQVGATSSVVQASVSSVAATPPKTTPPIPDGTYRVKLSQDDVLAGGSNDLGSVGIWTMTLSKGTYQVACKWLDASGLDCGNDGKPDTLVEIGPVRGDKSRVWFASDLQAVFKKTGCTPLSECGNPDPYSFAWTLRGSDLQFSDTVGFGANQGDVYKPWTFKPWTKIA